MSTVSAGVHLSSLEFLTSLKEKGVIHSWHFDAEDSCFFSWGCVQICSGEIKKKKKKTAAET